VWTVWDREMLCFHSFSEFSQTFVSVSITQEKSNKLITLEKIVFLLFTKTLQGKEGEITFLFLVSKRKVSLVAAIITSPARAGSCSYTVYRIAVIAVESAVKYSHDPTGCKLNYLSCLNKGLFFSINIHEIHNQYSKYIKQLFAKGEVNIGDYSPMFTEPEANDCFSIIFRGEYQEL